MGFIIVEQVLELLSIDGFPLFHNLLLGGICRIMMNLKNHFSSRGR